MKPNSKTLKQRIEDSQKKHGLFTGSRNNSERDTKLYGEEKPSISKKNCSETNNFKL